MSRHSLTEKPHCCLLTSLFKHTVKLLLAFTPLSSLGVIPMKLQDRSVPAKTISVQANQIQISTDVLGFEKTTGRISGRHGSCAKYCMTRRVVQSTVLQRGPLKREIRISNHRE